VKLEAFAGLKEGARNPAWGESKESASVLKRGFDKAFDVPGNSF
jgi:hypothetical protein